VVVQVSFAYFVSSAVKRFSSTAYKDATGNGSE
jgi:hypothetical protein